MRWYLSRDITKTLEGNCEIIGSKSRFPAVVKLISNAQTDCHGRRPSIVGQKPREETFHS